MKNERRCFGVGVGTGVVVMMEWLKDAIGLVCLCLLIVTFYFLAYGIGFN